MEDSLRVVLPDLENLDIEIKFVEDQNNSANRTITIAPNMSIPKGKTTCQISVKI